MNKIGKEICIDFWTIIGVLVFVVLCVAVCTRVVRADNDYHYNTKDGWHIDQSTDLWDLAPKPPTKPETWSPFKKRPSKIERPYPYRRPSSTDEGCWWCLGEE